MHPMAELKTRQNDQDVHEFLEGVSNETRKKDCYEVLELMRAATGVEAKMWGDSIIGFGSYHYKYASGREGDWFLTGFSPRKQNLTLYIMPGFEEYEGLMKKLGKYKTGKSCLYLNKLEDVDLAVLKTLIEKSVKKMQEV
jgi:hypothetical protein